MATLKLGYEGNRTAAYKVDTDAIHLQMSADNFDKDGFYWAYHKKKGFWVQFLPEDHVIMMLLHESIHETLNKTVSRTASSAYDDLDTTVIESWV